MGRDLSLKEKLQTIFTPGKVSRKLAEEAGLGGEYSEREDLLRSFRKERLAGAAANAMTDFVVKDITPVLVDEGLRKLAPGNKLLNKTIPGSPRGLTFQDVLSDVTGDIAGNYVGKHTGKALAGKLAERKAGKLKRLQELTSKLEPHIQKGHKFSARKAAALLRIGRVPGTSAISDIIPSWTKKSVDMGDPIKLKPIKPFKLKKINSPSVGPQTSVYDKIKKANPQTATQVSSVGKLKSAPKLPRNVKAQQ